MSAQQHTWGPDFIKAFRNGGEDAFDKVFRTYHAPLTYFANKYLKNEAAAEDIVQECFAELWERRRKLTEVQSISSYLYRCVYNHCSKYLKKIITEKEKLSLPIEPDMPAIIESEILVQLVRAMENLPERMKQVLQLHYLEDKTLEEISQEIGIDKETVRSHRYRGLKLLRKTIITG